jgi:hypothetical protein
MASKENISAQPATDPKSTKDLAGQQAGPKSGKDVPQGAPQPGIAADPKSVKSNTQTNKTLGNVDSKLQPLIHIDNFDAKKFQVINSPRSREAMKELGILDADLHLKTADDLRGLFNMADLEEKKAFDLCVKKHEKAHENLKKKISERRKELIKQREEQEKKRKEQEALKAKQLKQLEEEKKALLKQLEFEKKKREEEEKKKKAEHEKDLKKDAKPADKPADKAKPATANDNKSTTDLKKAVDPKAVTDAKKVDLNASAVSASPDKKTTNGKLPTRELSAITHKSEQERRLKLDQELKESSILMFLDKSVHHKELLDLDLKERTKKDLERDKVRMKELMKKQKEDLLELAQKRTASAYKSHEVLGNTKIRKIEHLYDLSRNPLQMMKEKQQKEMEQMMNHEIALQVPICYLAH